MGMVVAFLPRHQRKKLDALTHEDLFLMRRLLLEKTSFDLKGDGFGTWLVDNAVEDLIANQKINNVVAFRSRSSWIN